MKKITTQLLLTVCLTLCGSTWAHATPTHDKSPDEAKADSVNVPEEVPDLGRLPESFEMAYDSLLKAKYRDYFALGKNNRKSRALGSDKEYREKLAKMHSAIPLPYNPLIRESIEIFFNRRSHFLSSMLAKSSYYFPIIEDQLDKHGLPIELKYLAIIESALNPVAVSRMGATGLWQFMLPTGKLYGLKIDSLVDERRDPEKSTEAACKYFKDMYAIYGDWLLVIAAYNCGPGNVNRAIRRSGNTADFWSIYNNLPRETRSYVPLFIAAFYAMEHYHEYNIRPDAVQMPLATDTVRVNRKHTFAEMSRMSNVDVATIKQLNPKYRRDIIPGNAGADIVILPAKQATLFAVNKDSIYRATTPMPFVTESHTMTHRVRRGESLASVAKKYGVDIEDIKSWNNLRRNSLKRGQNLKIIIESQTPMDQSETYVAGIAEDAGGTADTQPQESKYGTVVGKSTTSSSTLQEEESAETHPKKKAKPTPKRKRTHTVKRGETLSGIASKYKGTSVSALRRANNIKGSKIKPGQKLVIP